MNQLPFQGLKVIELASVLAGPATGMFFAELGADVLKIENKRTDGDVTRSWKLPSEDASKPASAYYNSINWGKETLLLDLTDQQDKNRLLAHLETADVLVANFKKGSAEKLGLSYPEIITINPGIIYANLTAFGPSNDMPGYDVLLQAETGYLHMTGQPGGPPAKLPVALIDILAAHQLKEAILIALLQKQKTGKGSAISVSLAGSAIAALANQASNYLNEGLVPGRMGTQHPNICPYGDVFSTSDGFEFIVAIGNDSQFTRFCAIIGLNELANDDRFSTNSARVTNRQILIPMLASAIHQLQSKVLLGDLKKHDIPSGRLRNMKEVFETDLAQSMVLKNDNGSRCVTTIAFDIQSE